MGDNEFLDKELEDLLTFLAYDEPKMLVVGQSDWSTFFEIQEGVRMQVSIGKEAYVSKEGAGSEKLVRSENITGDYNVFLIVDRVKPKVFC